MAGALIEPDLSHQKLKLEHTEIAQKIFIELVIGCSTSVFGGIPPFSEFPNVRSVVLQSQSHITAVLMVKSQCFMVNPYLKP
jgi:hypothetical protein